MTLFWPIHEIAILYFVGVVIGFVGGIRVGLLLASYRREP